MVVIPITANVFSVITTLLSTVSELALYRTLGHLLAMYQCHVLSRNKTSNIRSQKRRLSAVAWGSLAVFLILETVLSVFSDAVKIRQPIVEDCVRLVAAPLATESLIAGDVGDEARIVCRKTDVNGELFVKEVGANMSTGDEGKGAQRAVRCEERELYGYFPGQQVNRDVQNETAACVEESCVYVIVDGEDLYLSARGRHEERSLEANKTWFAFYKTRVKFEVGDQVRQQLAMRLARSIHNGERDEERLRAQTLLGMKRDRCVRPDEQDDGRDGTRVLTGLLVGACVIWTVCLVGGLIRESGWIRGKAFFDMGCEVQWARRSFRECECGDGDVLLRGRVVDGERCVAVVHAGECCNQSTGLQRFSLS